MQLPHQPTHTDAVTAHTTPRATVRFAYTATGDGGGGGGGGATGCGEGGCVDEGAGVVGYRPYPVTGGCALPMTSLLPSNEALGCAPNRWVASYLSIHVSIYLSVYLSIYLSVCLSVCLSSRFGCRWHDVGGYVCACVID